MMYRLSILLLLAISLFGIISGARLVRNQAKKPLPPAPMAEPARSPYTESLAATGLILQLGNDLAAANLSLRKIG